MVKGMRSRSTRLDRRKRKRTKSATGAPPPQELKRGRPQRLAHLVAGSEQAKQQARAAAQNEAPTHAGVSPSNVAPASVNQAKLTLLQDVLRLPQPEWILQSLAVTGPAQDLAAFREGARGSGRIPWLSDYAHQEEDVLHYLLAPPPAERGISVQGARIVAQKIRQALETLEWRADQRARDRTCPFDLHALVPVPASVLRLGSDDPAALVWLWKNWGTTWALRSVEELDGRVLETAEEGHDAACYRFWSADWAPWQAIKTLRARWSTLTLRVSL